MEKALADGGDGGVALLPESGGGEGCDGVAVGADSGCGGSVGEDDNAASGVEDFHRDIQLNDRC